MVATRGHRESEAETKPCHPQRECRKPKTNFQEPEDEIIVWESDDNVRSRKTRSCVTFDCEKSISNSEGKSTNLRSKRNSDAKIKPSVLEDDTVKGSSRRTMSKDNDMIGVEADTDTDEDFFGHRRATAKNRRHSKLSKVRSPSPVKKEFVMNGDDDMTDKSDHETGLRRSLRQSKPVSWILDDRKLRGYPNMIHSSEPENDEIRPARKLSRYIHSSADKGGGSSAPQRRSQRFRKKSPEQRINRNRNYLLRQSGSRREEMSRYQRSRRHRRLPLRYRESQSEEEEEEEEEEEDDDAGDIDDDDFVQEIRGKKCRQRRSNRRNHNLTKKRVIQRNRRVPSRRESIDETENSEEENEYNRKRVQQSQRISRRPKRREFNDTEASSETEGKDDEQENNEEVEEKENEIASDQKIEKPKRERKPVSRLMYEPVRRCPTKIVSSDGENDDEEEEEEEEEGEENDDDNDAADEEEDEEGEQPKDSRPSQRGRYSLRQNRKTIAKDDYECLDESSSIRHRKQRGRDAKIKKLFSSPARKQRVFNKKYRATHNTATSSSSSSSDEKEFEKRYSKSITKARNRCLPMNFTPEDLAQAFVKERNKVGSSLADIDPMNVDLSVSFESVGGLSHHIKSLKEMIIFPLMYPEVFQKFSITPPRGVLFYGPPGTGKTLVARALASECSKKDKKVAFFMRKGADCLSKWVGESERQLRLLFDQAYQMRPSIIFFDEIDGLAPVRSSRQDQIHSSIVSTLLALMDGLDSRGEVVVIGATNRIDAIDSALRRPGRFDREFHFPLPSVKARSQILNIHTRNWSPRPSKRLLHFLSEQTVGYCGADLKALCAEATLIALRLKYPQIYLSKDKLLLDVSKIHIKCCHFRQALAKIVPAGQRATSSPGRKLTKIVQPLLQPILSQALKNLAQCFPFGLNNGVRDVTVYFPRLLICGLKGQGQTLHLAPAILHAMEKVHAHKLDLPSLFSVSARAPEEACAQIFHEARRNLPSIIYIPLLDQWWNTVTETVKATFLSLLSDFEPSTAILLLATSETPYNEMDEEVQRLFSSYRNELMVMSNPKEDLRRLFFRQLFFTKMIQKPKVKQRKNRVLETLPVAPPPQPRKLTEHELQQIERVEEATLRELRIFLRQICAKLAKNRMFYIFTKPVDLDEVPDYLDVISTPMDLETMMTKIDYHHYQCAEDFLNDIDLICANALEYNPDRNPEDKVIRHRACTLRDTAYAYIKAEMDTDFEMKCRDIRKARVYREQSGAELAPDFIKLAAADVNEKNGKINSGSSTPLNQSTSNDLSKSSGESNRKKRRRSTSWARGLLSSAKKRKCVDKEKEEETKPKMDNEAEAKNNNEENNVDCEENESVHSSQRDEEGIVGEDPSTDASQNKGIETSGLCNGNLSTEDSRDSMKVTSAADLLYNKSLKESIQKENIKISIETNGLKSVASHLEAEESVVSSSEPGCSTENREVRIDWSHLEAVYESCISVTEDATVDELQYLYNLLLGLTQKHSRSLERDSLLSDTEVELRKFAQFRMKP